MATVHRPQVSIIPGAAALSQQNCNVKVCHIKNTQFFYYNSGARAVCNKTDYQTPPSTQAMNYNLTDTLGTLPNLHSSLHLIMYVYTYPGLRARRWFARLCTCANIVRVRVYACVRVCTHTP